MYENATKLFSALPGALVETKHAAGVCSSFAMDWLKKKAANKPVNESTYTVRNRTWKHKDRLDKIIARQRKYEASNGDLDVEAKAYGLTYTWTKSCYGKFAGDFENMFREYDKSLPPGLYYFSFQMDRGEGHAIGYDKGEQQFCDANMGIYSLANTDANYMVAQVRNFMENVLGHACNKLVIGEVRLRPSSSCF